MTIPLPGVSGRIDHLAYNSNKQYVAALGNSTVEVVDLVAVLDAGNFKKLSDIKLNTNVRIDCDVYFNV